MNTLNTLGIDVVTRSVSGIPVPNAGTINAGALPSLEKMGNDLILQVIFQNNGQTIDTGIDSFSIQSLLLTIKTADTDEILLQSDSWSGSGSVYFLHATIAGSALSQILGTGSSMNLLGEIQWVQNNPFYGSANGNIGPATLRTSSQNFALTVGASLG
jgi:hypothetical protein